MTLQEALEGWFRHLKPERAQRLLLQVPEEQRGLIVDLLRYPDDTAGGIMTNQLVCVPAGLRVGEARRELKGRISAPDFAVAEDDQPIGALMNPRVTSIQALAPASAASRQVAEQHLAALPVTSRDGRLLGAVTVDAAMAQLAPASWRDQAPRVVS